MDQHSALLFSEDWGGFAPGPFPYDPDHSAMGEYHYYPNKGYAGNWYDPITHYSYKGPTWLFVKMDGKTALEQMRVTTPGGVTACPTLVCGEKDWTDYEVCVQVQPLSTAEPCGVLFRYQTSLCHYAFLVGGGKAQVLRNEKYDAEVLAEAPFELDGDRSYALCVRVCGDKFTCLVDGQTVLTAQDGRYKCGSVALTAYMPARFGSVSVSCDCDALQKLHERRAREQAELAQLQAQIPQPKLQKVINLKPFGAGRQIRFGHLTGTEELFFIMAQNQKRVFKDRYGRISCLTAVSLSTGEILWQKGDPMPGEDHAYLTADLPMQIYDIDGDGVDEVICAIDFDLMILDGKTGAVKKSIKTPYNTEPADQLPGIEFGKHAFDRLNVDAIRIVNVSGNARPQEILIKDRYARLWVYDSDLNLKWTYAHGNTGHFPFAYDFDGDGKDEILSCYNMIGSDGSHLWQLPIHTDHVDEIIVGKFAPDGPETIALVAGWEGFILADRHGNILKRDVNGHGQRISCANYRPDLSGYEIACTTYWGHQGIVYLYDCHGNELWHLETGGNGNVITPVNWTNDGGALLLLNASCRHGGMVDGQGRLVVRFPDDGHPELCCEAIDLNGDGRHEIICWDHERLYIYGQDRPPKENLPKLRFASYPHHNASNYRGEYLFSHQEEPT